MLEKFIGSSDPWVNEKAKIVAELKSMFESSELTQAEYKELLEDIIRTDSIASQGKELELKSNFIKALNIISKAL